MKPDDVKPYDAKAPLTPGTMRTYVNDFGDLLAALRVTHADDPNVMLSVRVIFDSSVVTHAIGSTDLALAAIGEALRLIGPHVIPQSYVAIEIHAAGTRAGWLV